VAVQIAGEQPVLLVPLTGPPFRINVSHQPRQPFCLDAGTLLGLAADKETQR
jgi:hypothetical protein